LQDNNLNSIIENSLKNKMISYKKLFEGLSIFEKIEYILMCIFAISICISWKFGVWALMLLFVEMVVKACVNRHIGNPSYSKGALWGAVLMIGYFLVYLISMTYSANKQEGWKIISTLLPFVFFPLFFMLTDTSYLNRNHIRAILYVFSVTLMIRFFIRLGIAGYDYLLEGKGININTFDPIHHAYLSLYTILALTFIFGELIYHSKNMPKFVAPLLVVDTILMILYTLIIQSRAGVLCMAVMTVIFLIQLTCSKQHRKIGIATICTFIILGTIAFVATKDSPKFHRLEETVSQVASGKKNDIRFNIWSSATTTISQNMPLGVGVGDRMDALDANQHFYDPTYTKTRHVYNPHNQYLDTMLATGVAGEVLLVAFLILPFVLYLFKGRRVAYFNYLLPLMLIIILSAPFESIFQRQMGILFFCFFYLLFFIQPKELGESDESKR